MKLFKKISFIIIIISIIFTSGYALSVTDAFSKLKIPLLLISFILLGIIYLQMQKKNKSFRLICFTIFIILFTFFSTFLNYSRVNFNSFLFLAFVLFFALIFTRVVDYRIFLKGFVIGMSIISSIALFNYLLTNIINLDLNLPLITNINGTVYQNGIICFRILYSTGYSSRIMGLFWEPGIFASYVTIALLIEILTNGKSKYNKLIFILSLLISQSTAGYILLFLCIIIWALKIKGIKKYFSIFILFIVGVFTIAYFDKILEYLIGTGISIFVKLDKNSDTTATRIKSMIYNWEIFMSSPFYGIGLGEANGIFNAITDGLVSQTSTSTYFMASFGIFGVIFTLIPVIFGIKIGIQRKSIIIGIVLPIMFIFILNKEPHSSFTIDFIFMFYLYEQLLSKKKTLNS